MLPRVVAEDAVRVQAEPFVSPPTARKRPLPISRERKRQSSANGFGGAGDVGYSVTDDADAAFWSEFQQWGGVDRVGYPITNRFAYRGFLTQAFQKLVLQWRPELGHAVPVNVLDDLDQQGSDAWLSASRAVPRPSLTSGDADQAWEAVANRHIALLDGYATLQAFYAAQDDAVERFGLPVGVDDYGSVVSVRLQRNRGQPRRTVLAASRGCSPCTRLAWPQDSHVFGQ